MRILLLLFVLVSCARETKLEPKKVERYVPRFSKGECIFGGRGGNDPNKVNSLDQGYQIVKVDVDRGQYLLKCLTMECTGGLRTDWIKSYDEFMLEIDCDEIKDINEETSRD